MNVKQIDPNIIDEIVQYRNCIKSRGINVTKIILFGSVAKGINDKHSDIDIAVVSPKFGKNYDRELHKLMLLRKNYDIEPHPFSSKELDNKYNALANEIKKYGVLIK